MSGQYPFRPESRWEPLNDEAYPDSVPEPGGRFWGSGPGDTGSWFDSLRQLWHWDELAAEVGQENLARVALVGPPGVGKSLLLNRLRGWAISDDDGELALGATAWRLETDLMLESLGFFVLADLPPQAPLLSNHELILSLGNPVLVVYLLNGVQGVTAIDYRWIAALRATGKPLLVAANKADLMEDVEAATAEAARRLGMPVIPISAQTGANVENVLLPAMLDAVPRLAVPLGRELLSLRRAASRRVIRQAALFAGLVGVQPVPLLDLPFQAIVQVGVVMRVGAAFGYVPTGGMSREVLGTVVSTLGLRYLVLALVKFIPFIGWLVAGVLSSLMTLLLGEAAIRYYEAGATVSLAHVWAKTRRQKRIWPWQRWIKKRWITAAVTPDVAAEVSETTAATAEIGEES